MLSDPPPKRVQTSFPVTVMIRVTNPEERAVDAVAVKQLDQFDERLRWG
jgi:hypothetical protein